MPRQRSRNKDFYPLLLLFAQLQRIGINNVPSVTLLFFGINIAVFVLLDYIPLREVCIQPGLVFYHGQYERILLSAFFHADSWHLYYNMASFLWKGNQIESKLGATRMFIFIMLAAVCSSILYVLGGLMIANYYETDAKLSSCAVGFSAVLFSLKVVLFHGSNAWSNFYGFQIPAKYLAWVELFVISLISPNASFLGHLCGILVGVLYTLGIFNFIFYFTDQLPIDSILNAMLRRNTGYENSSQNRNRNRSRRGGFQQHNRYQ